MLLNQGKGVFHPNKQEGLLEETLEEVLRDRGTQNVFIEGVWRDEALFYHLVDLLLLSEDFVISEEAEEFVLGDFILLVCVHLSPKVTDQLVKLLQRVAQVGLCGCLRLPLIRRAFDSAILFLLAEGLACFEAVISLRPEIFWHLTFQSASIKIVLLVEPLELFTLLADRGNQRMPLRFFPLSSACTR